jgi:hypothetical protein
MFPDVLYEQSKQFLALAQLLARASLFSHNRVKIEPGRIADSIQRLTTGTPLEGVIVLRRRSRDRDRVAFRAEIVPANSPVSSLTFLNAICD